jgi:hypothetical protein
MEKLRRIRLRKLFSSSTSCSTRAHPITRR